MCLTMIIKTGEAVYCLSDNHGTILNKTRAEIHDAEELLEAVKWTGDIGSKVMLLNGGVLTYSSNKPMELTSVKQFIADNDYTSDPELIYTLTTPGELSGIFNWAYEGLQRALKNGKLSEPTDIQSRKELYQNMSDPATGFIREYIAENNQAVTPREDFYRAFVEYCNRSGFVAPSDTTLYKAIRKECYCKEAQRTIDGVPRQRVFLGIELMGTQNVTRVTQVTAFSNFPEKQEILEKYKKGVTSVTAVTFPASSDLEDSDLINFASKYLKNNGGFASTEDIVRCLFDEGYNFEDFKRLKNYSTVFRVEGSIIHICEVSP